MYASSGPSSFPKKLRSIGISLGLSSLAMHGGTCLWPRFDLQAFKLKGAPDFFNLTKGVLNSTRPCVVVLLLSYVVYKHLTRCVSGKMFHHACLSSLIFDSCLKELSSCPILHFSIRKLESLTQFSCRLKKILRYIPLLYARALNSPLVEIQRLHAAHSQGSIRPWDRETE